MSGPNGLRPIEVLADRQKCAESPTKKKFATADEAWTEARSRTAQSGIDIAPYSCSSCGSIHLTKRVTGSDVLTRQPDGKIVTGAQRRAGRNHPVFATPPARVPLPEPESSEPPIAGNKEARLKVLRSWLSDGKEPSTEQVAAVLGGNPARDTMRALMRELGYENTKGRSARWVRRPENAAQEPPAPLSAPLPAWMPVDASQVATLALADLRAAYEAIGMEMRIEVRPRA